MENGSLFSLVGKRLLGRENHRGDRAVQETDGHKEEKSYRGDRGQYRGLRAVEGTEGPRGQRGP